MPDLINLQKEILDFIIRKEAGKEDRYLREWCANKGYSEKRVAGKVISMYPALEYGTSPMVPFTHERAAIERMYEMWDVEPPEEINEVEFRN